MPKRKRRLTEDELLDIQAWMDSSPMGRKPTIGQIAKRYNVNKPSVIKSMKVKKPVSKFSKSLNTEGFPLKLEGYTIEQ